MVGGMLWAAIPALLKTRFGTNEILTSLMLVYVAQLSSTGWCAARGAIRTVINFPQTGRSTTRQLLPVDAGQHRHGQRHLRARRRRSPPGS